MISLESDKMTAFWPNLISIWQYWKQAGAELGHVQLSYLLLEEYQWAVWFKDPTSAHICTLGGVAVSRRSAVDWQQRSGYNW